jgi:hypothetical protein
MAYYSTVQFAPNDFTGKNIAPSVAHRFTIDQIQSIQILEDYDENFVWQLTQIGSFVVS